MLTTDELLAIILHKVDIIELIEVLQISTEDLLDRFEDRIELYWDELNEAVDNHE